MDVTPEMLDMLTQDQDTYDLGDGRTLRLLIQPDEGVNPFDGTDIYGQVKEPKRSQYYLNERPDDFDGNAEKLHVGRSHDEWWWQPPTDGPKRGTPLFDEIRALVIDLIEFGYIVVTVELLNSEDAYGRPIVVQVQSLGGVEPRPNKEYLAEIITDLIEEME